MEDSVPLGPRFHWGATRGEHQTNGEKWQPLKLTDAESFQCGSSKLETMFSDQIFFSLDQSYLGSNILVPALSLSQIHLRNGRQASTPALSRFVWRTWDYVVPQCRQNERRNYPALGRPCVSEIVNSFWFSYHRSFKCWSPRLMSDPITHMRTRFCNTQPFM